MTPSHKIIPSHKPLLMWVSVGVAGYGIVLLFLLFLYIALFWIDCLIELVYWII